MKVEIEFYRRHRIGLDKNVLWEVQDVCLKIGEVKLEKRKYKGRLEIFVVQLAAPHLNRKGRIIKVTKKRRA